MVRCSELTWPLKQRWFWMLFFTILAAVLGAFVIVELIFALSPGSIIIALIVVFMLWVILRSYRKWASEESEEEEEEAETGGLGHFMREFLGSVFTETLFHKD